MPSAPPKSPEQDSKAPHLLYIAWGFPPCRGGGVYRALATANTFAQNGWRVTVLTAERETFERFTGTDDSLEVEIDPRVDVLRIPFDWPAHETDIRKYGTFRAYLPRVWRRLRAYRDRIDFPETNYGPWRSRLEAEAARIHADRPVDLTVATANPNVTFAAAYALHEKAGVPYVMDYRDAWLLDVFKGTQVFGDHSRAARWERTLIANAQEIWFVNDPIRAWHSHRYPEHASRMHVVSNGWDPALLQSGLAEPEERHRVLTFGYLGTISDKVPIATVISAWRTAKTEGDLPQDAKLVIAGYLGYFAVPRQELIQMIEEGRADGVSYAGPIPKTEVSDFYSGIDVLVLALGTGRYVTSGKVFEYIATAKPIVSVHDAGNATSDVLSGYPGWVPSGDLSPRAVTAALVDGARVHAATSPTVEQERRIFAARFSRDRQFAPRIAALNDAVNA